MIRKNIREKGKKIADKNWVLTAYDELSADGDVSAIAPANQGQAARTTGKSRGKVTAKASKEQGKGKKKVTVEYDLESNTWKGIPKEANLVSTGKAERGIVEGFTNDPRIRAMHDTRTGKTWLRVDTFDNNAETPARINRVLEGEGYEIDVDGDSSGFVDFNNFEDAKRFADHVENVQEQVDAEREKLRLQNAEERYQRGVDGVKPSKAEVALRVAVIDKLRESGIEVLGAAEGQKVLDMANGKDVRLEAKRKRALETASLRNNLRSLTVIPSADGAKVLKKIDILTKELEKLPTQPKTFIGDVAKALDARRYGSSSEYATFETKNGKVVTIRLSNHNAKVAVLEDTVEKLEQERAAAMSQAVDEEQQHKVQEALDWFAAKMSVFSKEEQEAINACAIAFAERDLVVIPKVSIAVNAKCSQADLMAYASSTFFKIGKKRKDIARFLSIVFEAYFPGGEGFVYKKMPGAKECQK